MDEFRNYKRKPIQITRNTFALLHMFEYGPDHWEDIMLDERICHKINKVDYKEAAQQFISQFEGNECLAFIDALRDECNKIIIEHDTRVSAMGDKLLAAGLIKEK